MGFVYVLKFRDKPGIKVGSSSNNDKSYGRLYSYGTHCPEPFSVIILDITSVPDTIKCLFHEDVNGLWNPSFGDEEYAEVFLHRHLRGRIRHKTTGHQTEFFIDEELSGCFDIVGNKVESLLKEYDITYDRGGPYEHLGDIPKGTGEPKKSKEQPSSVKVTRPNPTTLHPDIPTGLSEDPISFIEKWILCGKPLRKIQRDLWEKLIDNPGDIRGLIHWPTGTGKRVAIIMVVIALYLYYKEKNMPFRCVIIANRLDIFDGGPWSDYKTLDLLGLLVHKYLKGGVLDEIDCASSFLLIATHQSLAQGENDHWGRLDPTCVIYDEVQNITSPKMHGYLVENTPTHLIGASATIDTGEPDHDRKVNELFGGRFLSQYSNGDAVRDGAICPCKYYIQPETDMSEQLETIQMLIKYRELRGILKRRKFMIWIPDTNKRKDEYISHFNTNTTWKIFPDSKQGLKDFSNQNMTGELWGLILCQKGREGFDERDVEFGVSIGNSATHLYIQEQGRSQRIDYEGKVSELLIFADSNQIEEDIMREIGYDCIGTLDPDIIGKVSDEKEDERAKIQAELDREQAILNAKQAELDAGMKDSNLTFLADIEKKLKDKRDITRKRRNLKKRVTDGPLSTEIAQEIVESHGITCPQDIDISELAGEYKIELTYQDFTINWSAYNPQYYQDPKDCITSIKKIYQANKRDLKDRNKQGRHGFYQGKDPKIPPFETTRNLPKFWGKAVDYNDSDFKLQ
jgi:hypothetical protein